MSQYNGLEVQEEILWPSLQTIYKTVVNESLQQDLRPPPRCSGIRCVTMIRAVVYPQGTSSFSAAAPSPPRSPQSILSDQPGCRGHRWSEDTDRAGDPAGKEPGMSISASLSPLPLLPRFPSA